MCTGKIARYARNSASTKHFPRWKLNRLYGVYNDVGTITTYGFQFRRGKL